MPEHGEAIIRRFKDAKKRVEPFQHILDEVFTYCLPHRDAFAVGDSKGNVTTNAMIVVDSTASMAYMDLAGDYQLGLTPPNEQWTRQELEPGAITRMGLSPDDVLQVKRELDAQTDEIFRFLGQSNFDTEMHESYLDMIASTGALLVNEGDDLDPLQFKAVPTNEFVPEEGPNGRIETVFRQHQLHARNLPRQWPDAKWTDETHRAIEERPDVKVKLLEVTAFNPQTMKYDYTVLEEDKQHVALEDTFDVTPWVVFRSNVVPGEVLGRGPGFMALPDVKTLNEMVRLTLENATWAIVGAYQSDDYGVVNVESVELNAGVIIPVQGEGIRPIERSGDFRISQEMIADLRQTVMGYFLRAQLPPTDAPVRTATEIGTRAEIALNRIGPPTTRVYSELIRPLWRRVKDILIRRSLLAPIDGLDERDIRVVPVSPFAQVAEQARSQRGLNALATAGQLAPNETVQNVDLVGWVKGFLEDNGFPTAFIRTDGEAEQIAQAQAAEQALDTAAQSGVLSQAVAQGV